MLEAVVVTSYLIVCGLWGIFSVNMQYMMYPDKTSNLIIYGVFFLNALSCPISMIVALIRFDSYMGDIKKAAAREAVKEYVIKERMG